MGLRDDIFNNSAEPVSAGFSERNDVIANEPAFIHEPVVREESLGDDGLVLRSGSDLDSFHTTQPEDDEPNNTPKILGALAVALMLGGAGAYAYLSSGSPSQTVTAARLPENPPKQMAAATPPAPPAAAQAPVSQDISMPSADGTTAKTTGKEVAAPVKSADETPVRHHRIAKAEKSDDSVIPATQTAAATPAPSQQVATASPAAPAPEIASPAPAAPANGQQLAANNSQAVTTPSSVAQDNAAAQQSTTPDQAQALPQSPTTPAPAPSSTVASNQPAVNPAQPETVTAPAPAAQAPSVSQPASATPAPADQAAPAAPQQ